jgi:hypothetical protein
MPNREFGGARFERNSNGVENIVWWYKGRIFAAFLGP